MSKKDVEAAPIPELRTVRFWLPLLLIFILWLRFLWSLRIEWALNLNYSYGPLIPIAAILLFWLRIDDWRTPCGPKPSHRTLYVIWITFAVVLLSPVSIVGEVNPDWRLVMWLKMGILTLATLAILLSIGGRSWAVAALPLFGLLAFCIPWPMEVERSLLSVLLKMVSTAAADLFYVFDFDVIQKGNLLRIDGVPIGIDEACSGIRSFQVTVVVITFLLMWRPLPPPRALLVLLGGLLTCCVSNLCRILCLGVIGVKGGSEAIDKWHDTVGWCSTALIFAGIALVWWLVNPSVKSKDHSRLSLFFERRALLNRSVTTWSPGGIVTLACVAVFVPSSVFLFYAKPDATASASNVIAAYQFDWSRLGDDTTLIPIPETVTEQLRYTEASRFSLFDPTSSGRSIQGYEFFWDDGIVSSFTSVHRPQNCLPSIGYRMISELRPFFLRLSHGSIPVHPFVFELDGRAFFVFHSLWDIQSGRDVISDSSATTRLDAVWERQRFGPRQAILMIVAGEPDIRRAVQVFATCVRRAEVFPE